MKSFLAVIVVVLAMFGIIIGIACLEQIVNPYFYTAEYCYPNGTDCSYIQDNTDSSSCPEWYDPQVIIGPMGDMRLKDGTCKMSQN